MYELHFTQKRDCRKHTHAHITTHWHTVSKKMMSTPAQRSPAAAPPSNPSTPQQLTKAQKRTLLQLQQSEADKKRIKLANVELMKAQMRCSERTMLSPPEKKQCNILVADDDLRPCFSVGDYVKVNADTSPGMNRPEGRGWISSIRGVGGGVQLGQFEGGLHRGTAIEFIRNALFLSSAMNKKQKTLILLVIFAITGVLEAATTSWFIMMKSGFGVW